MELRIRVNANNSEFKDFCFLLDFHIKGQRKFGSYILGTWNDVLLYIHISDDVRIKIQDNS